MPAGTHAVVGQLSHGRDLGFMVFAVFTQRVYVRTVAPTFSLDCGFPRARWFPPSFCSVSFTLCSSLLLCLRSVPFLSPCPLLWSVNTWGPPNRSSRTLALFLFLRPRGILLREYSCCLPCIVSSCSRWLGFGISAHRTFRRSTVPCFHVPFLVRPCPH